MARARTRLGGDYDVVAVIGDGALTGGLAYEGLSNAGQCGRAAGGHPQRQRHEHTAAMSAAWPGCSAACVCKPGYFGFKRWYRSTVGQVKPVYDMPYTG